MSGLTTFAGAIKTPENIMGDENGSLGSFRRRARACVACASTSETGAQETQNSTVGASTTAFSAAVAAPPPPSVAPEARAGSPPTIFAWDEMRFTETDVGRRTQLIDEASRSLHQLEIHITTLNPGMSSRAPHRHANEEVILLHEGHLRVYVNGETKDIGPGSVMVFLSNDWHSVNNIGDTPATYHVINYHP